MESVEASSISTGAVRQKFGSKMDPVAVHWALVFPGLHLGHLLGFQAGDWLAGWWEETAAGSGSQTVPV